jgi:hypothetical protein
MTGKTLLIIALLAAATYPQKKIEVKNLFSSYTRQSSRTHYKKELQRKAEALLTNKNLSTKEKISILDEISLMYFRPPGIFNFIKKSLSDFHSNSPEFNNHLLEALKALYPDSSKSLIGKIVRQTKDISTFVYGACVLMHYPKKFELAFVDSLIETKFPNSNNLLLKLFRSEINSEQTSIKEELSEILSSPFQKGKTIIFSFQRCDRSFPGLTIIRKPDGKFVRNDGGKIFAVPQLAFSVANLPGYLKNGNTPQGIFSVVGFYITQKESIGPTPIILTRIPFGKSPEIFFHGQNNFKKWNIKDYKALLPSSLKDYPPIYEAFYSGKLGRRLLVMHGSTDDLDFYRGEKYFPLTPTRGCLSTIEIWNESGYAIRSDQAQLVNAFFRTKQPKGFLVVLNIDDEKKPVTLDELLPFIQEAERMLHASP